MARRLLIALLTIAPAAVPVAAPAAAQAPAGEGPSVSAPDTVPGAVAGRVVSSLDGTTVSGALVRIRSPEGGEQVTFTGADGRYRLPRVAPGGWSLEVSTLDHDPFRAAVRVSPGESMELDVVLAPRPVVLPSLSAVTDALVLVPNGGDGGDADDEVRGSQGDPSLRALDTGPGAAGMARTLEGAPNRPPQDPSSVLYVRGGAADLKRVLLDGAPVYAPFHLGGLMDAVPAGVVRSAHLYTGGAPLAYDGGLSYVLDLRTRSGGEGPFSTSGHLDMLGGAVRADGSTGRLAWMASGRRTHGAASNGLLDGRIPYGYEELLGRVDLSLSEGHQLAVTGFSNRESVRLAGTPAGDRASWGNEAASLRYGARLGGSRALLTAAASHFDARLPVSATAEELGRSETGRVRVALDVTTPTGGPELSYGAAFNRHRTDVVLPAADDSTPGLLWLGRASTVAGYGAATFHPWPELDLRAGLRTTVHGGAGSPHLAPRVALTWRAGERTDLQLSAGRYHQLLESPESALSADLDEWGETLQQQAAVAMTADEQSQEGMYDAASASASHLTVRMDHRPREELELGLEAFFKSFTGLAEDRQLHASGADLWLDYRSDAWAAWAGYSLAWTWSDPAPEGAEESFSGRQLLSAGGRAPLPAGLRMAAQVRASSGLPFSRIPLTGGGSGPGASPLSGTATEALEGPEAGPVLSGAPDGSYLRFDVTLSRPFTGRVFGHETPLRPYLRFLNALDRRDALFYQFDPSREMRPRALDSLPVLPVIGLEWGVP